MISKEWIGAWETEAPLTPEQAEEDKPILMKLLQVVPDGVTIRSWEVWVNGRIYSWRRFDVTQFGGPR